MKYEHIEIYKKYLDTFGIKSESRICIEEMSELTKELCKLERYRDSDKEMQIVENIKEEIADVLNTVEQLYLYYGPEEIDRIREFKLKRGLEKLNNKKEPND